MTTKLNPVVVTEANLGDAAFDGVRRRPVVAINDDGNLVVCCRRTAAKNGWKLQGSLHQRTRTSKKAPAAPVQPTEAKVAAKAKKDRRATDKLEVAVVPKAALNTIRAARTVLDDSVDSILGSV